MLSSLVQFAARRGPSSASTVPAGSSKWVCPSSVGKWPRPRLEPVKCRAVTKALPLEWSPWQCPWTEMCVDKTTRVCSLLPEVCLTIRKSVCHLNLDACLHRLSWFLSVRILHFHILQTSKHCTKLDYLILLTQIVIVVKLQLSFYNEEN